MIIEATIAFVLIVSAASLIYLLGRRAAPKPGQTAEERTAYACGEKVTFPQLRVNVSLYKYLIYFVILDSSVLLLAFGALNFGPLAASGINTPLVLLYLFMMLAAGLLLLDGGNKND
jgi:NADH:ubiquinone oxidoreductase subunit 3 (subunit A)